MARWLTLAEFGDIEVNASPILAAETLRRKNTGGDKKIELF